METQSEQITMTLGELEAMKESIRTNAKVDELAKFMTTHDTEDSKHFDAIFSELRQIDSDVRGIPQSMARCQHELRRETEEKYVSKKEIRAGFLAVSAIQIIIGLILMGALNSVVSVGVGTGT